MNDREIIKITIRHATPDDAPLIAEAVVGAIGPEIAAGMAGDMHSVQDVTDVFERLARRTDTQYSYLNSRVAITPDGEPAGVCVSYDGARLRELRRPFFEEARTALGWTITPDEVEALPGETDSGEFYLDSLLTLPAFRGHGVASALIRDAARRAAETGKPLGLLVDTGNDRARRLYEHAGMHPVGMRPFAGHMMHHMQM